MTVYITDDLAALGACEKAICRVAALGGAATPAAYLKAYPDDWTDLVWLAWRLHRAGRIHCPGLVWSIARIAFRDLPPPLNQYAEALGADNWRDVYIAAFAAFADDAVVAAAAAADTAARAAADVVGNVGAARAAADVAGGVAYARAEIVAMCLEALS